MSVRPTASLALATLSLLLGLGTGCTRNDSIVAEAPRTEPRTEPSSDPNPVPPSPIVVAKSDADAPKLGSPCVDPSLCGTRGRVAIRAFSSHSFRPLSERPCKPLVLTTLQTSMVRESVSACVEGDRLYVESSCAICRLPTGTVVEGLVSEMASGQASFAQAQAGLGTLAPLRTVSAWQDAIRAANASANKPRGG